MPAMKLRIWIAILGVAFLVACGNNAGEFGGTMVAPAETTTALTRAAQPSATPSLTPQPPEVPSPQEEQPASPTPVPQQTTQPPPTPVPPSATPVSPTVTPQPTATEPPASSGRSTEYLGIRRQFGELSAIWTLADVRVGLHPDRVRVVFEVNENHKAGPYTEIIEVDNTTTPFPREGSLVDESWGQARIDVMISDCYAFEFPLQEELPIILNHPIVTKVDLYPTMDDARLGFSIGLTRPAPYQVYMLTDPVRIVIDILTES